MATSRPFAYNAGSQIGTNTQKGNLAVGPTGATASYADKPGNVQWWNGPDEDLGYIIAEGVSNQPNPAGIQAKVGFFRSNGKTDQAFIDLVSAIADQNFSSSAAALAWINANNNYWTSFESPTGSATGYGYNLVQLPYQNPSTGNVIMPNQGSTAVGGLNPNLLGTGGIWWSRYDAAGNDNFNYYIGVTASTFTLTVTQNGNTAIYSGTTGDLKYQTGALPGGSTFQNFFVQPNSGITLVQNAGVTGFSTSTPVYIGVSSSYTPPAPPTPSPTGAGATGTFTLVQLPYELPATGTVLMVNNGIAGVTMGILNPNILGTGGLYWSRYDVNGSDMYSSYIGATVAQARVDVWQTGKTASYYAPTGSIFYIENTNGTTNYKSFGYYYEGITGGTALEYAWTLLSGSPSNFTQGQPTSVRYTII